MQGNEKQHEGYKNAFDALDIWPNTKKVKNIRTDAVLFSVVPI
jgi:hypothetical protein